MAANATYALISLTAGVVALRVRAERTRRQVAAQVSAAIHVCRVSQTAMAILEAAARLISASIVTTAERAAENALTPAMAVDALIASTILCHSQVLGLQRIKAVGKLRTGSRILGRWLGVTAHARHRAAGRCSQLRELQRQVEVGAAIVSVLMRWLVD